MSTFGIITFHDSYNFGAVLQAYALQETVKSFGVDCKIINYRRKSTKIAYKIFRDGITKFNIYYNLNALTKYSLLKKREKKFEKFITNYMNLSIELKSYQELEKNYPKYDGYICGSDQIWNPISKDIRGYFLEFIKEKNCTKIAYAPSLGVKEIPKEKMEFFKKTLESFDAISVRENQSVEIINKIADKNVVSCVDPVILPDRNFWEKNIIEIKIKKPYIVVYGLLRSDELNEIVKALKCKYNYQVVVIAYSAINWVCPKDVIIWDAGPLDFITYIKNAEVVVTSSFHGTAFSILFEKEFYSVIGNNGNMRIENLLNFLDLSDRAIKDDVNLSNIKEINYKIVNVKLNELKNKSIEFLKNALKS